MMLNESASHRETSTRETEESQGSNGSCERVYKGLGVSRGIGIGPIYLYTRDALNVEQRVIPAGEIERELARFEDAVQRAEKELAKITSVAREKLGENSARIFEAQALMLKDETFLSVVKNKIRRDKTNASYAIKSFISESRGRMEASGSDYFRERANDLLDVQDRLIRNLRRGKLLSAIDPNTIVVSENLTAADIILFSRRNILGCATEFGGPTSHVSLMARGLGVPAIVSLSGVTKELSAGDQVILDGFNGRLIVNPSKRTLSAYERLRDRYQQLLEDEKSLLPLPSETLEGEAIALRANLEFREEVESVKKYGATGVGLFRTEFLFLMHGFQDYGEDAQYDTYCAIVSAISPETTTFRLLDLGGDKMLPMAHREHNPFLGWRGIRILLDKPELLRPQLKALYRAAARGPVRILVPMVSMVTEIVELKRIIEEVKEELRSAGTPFSNDVPLGIMVEVPTVALMADHFAKEVDFFSIGTNDLTQYLLAVDRGNNLVAGLYQELDPAVLKVIKEIVAAAKRYRIPVSVCGELASDPLATAILIGLGVEELSASPMFLPEIKRVVRSMRRGEAESLAQRVMKIFDPATRKATLMDWLRVHAPDYYSFLRDSENSALSLESDEA